MLPTLFLSLTFFLSPDFPCFPLASTCSYWLQFLPQVSHASLVLLIFPSPCLHLFFFHFLHLLSSDFSQFPFIAWFLHFFQLALPALPRLIAFVCSFFSCLVSPYFTRFCWICLLCLLQPVLLVYCFGQFCCFSLICLLPSVSFFSACFRLVLLNLPICYLHLISLVYFLFFCFTAFIHLVSPEPDHSCFLLPSLTLPSMSFLTWFSLIFLTCFFPAFILFPLLSFVPT